MSVNISKTKILIFNKAGKFMKRNFLFNGKVLDCTDSYKYLGIMFTSSGSFTEAKNELYKKAVKALYKLKANVFSLYPLPKTSLHIFDHTIKSILLYCSEIWGCYISKSADSDFLFNYSRMSCVMPCDKLHMHICKYILGVGKKSSNFATFSELGRTPFALDCFNSVFKYWNRLDTTNNNLLKDAYIENKQLHSRGCVTWYSCVHRLLEVFDSNTRIHKMLKYKNNTFNCNIKKLVKTFYINKWYTTRNKLLTDNSKLRTYLQFKSNFGLEKYLNIISDYNQRKYLTKFRISNHKLKIETGRSTKPKTPLEDRICDKCFSDEIESEEHFLLRCSFYDISRNTLLNKIYKSINYSNYNNMSPNDKILWLLNNENKEILNNICEFLSNSHCVK